MKEIRGYIGRIGFLGTALLFLYLLNPFGLNLYFGYLLVIFILLKKAFLRENLDSNFVLLLGMSITYSLFYYLHPNSGVQFTIAYAFFPATFYLLGKYITEKLDKSENRLFYFLFALGVVYSLSPLISVLINIRQGGFGQIDRSLPLFWNGQIVSATIMGSFFVLNMCIPSLLTVKRQSSIWFNIFAIAIFGLSLACILRIGSRTQILVSLVTLFCTLVYIVPRQSFQRSVVMFVLFIVGVSILLSNVSFDLDQDWLSTFAGRMEKGGADDIASGGGRTERWAKSIENLFAKPLGWNVEEFGHSHNLWLDVLRVSGIIPFFLLLIFTIKSLINIKSVISINDHHPYFNNQIIVYSLAFFLVFMVEPIFEGVLEMFLVFCLLTGVLKKYRTV